MAEKINLRDIPQEDIKAALDLLAKDKERKRRIAAGELKGAKKWTELTEAEKNKFKEAEKKRRLRNKIILQKAAEAGITASDAEVAAEMSK